MSIKNKQGATVSDVADYVKSRYVHEALSGQNLSHLIQDLDIPAPTEGQKILKQRFDVQMENAVRYFKNDEPLPMPELTDEQKEIVNEELRQQQLNQQAPVLNANGQTSPAQGTNAPKGGAAMTPPRSSSQPKQPFKSP